MRAQRPHLPPWFSAITVLAALALLAWVLSSITSIHDRMALISPKLAGGALIVMLLVLLGILAFGLHFLWTAWRAGRETLIEPPVPADPGEAAVASVAAAREQIEQVANEVARRALSHDLDSLAPAASRR